MASPNTLARRAAEPRRHLTYIGDYGFRVKDGKQTEELVRQNTPGSVIIPRSCRRAFGYRVEASGALTAIGKIKGQRRHKKRF